MAAVEWLLHPVGRRSEPCPDWSARASRRTVRDRGRQRGIVDTFAFRRLRPYLRGRIGATASSSTSTPISPAARSSCRTRTSTPIFAPLSGPRLARAKTPFGSSGCTPPTACSSSTGPCRRPSRQTATSACRCSATLPGGSSAMLAGVMNGVADGASADVDTTTARTCRAGSSSVHSTLRRRALLGGLGFALSGSTGRQSGAAALPPLSDRTLSSPSFRYSGAVADGMRTRYSPYVCYSTRPSAAGRVRPQRRCPSGADTDRRRHRARSLAGCRLMGADRRSATDGAGVRPREPTSISATDTGAPSRSPPATTRLTVDRTGVHLGFAAAGSSRNGRGVDDRPELVLHAEHPGTRSISSGPCSTATPTARAGRERVAFRTQFYF